MPTVKVQRPLSPSGGEWLFYDKARKHIESLPPHLIPTYVKDAMNGDYKAYFSGEWSSIVGWGLSKRVKSEDW